MSPFRLYRDMFSETDALAAAKAAKLAIAAQQVVRRLPAPPLTVVACGQGEFLAARLLERMKSSARLVSLAAELGPELSRVGTAHALAVLAREGV